MKGKERAGLALGLCAAFSACCIAARAEDADKWKDAIEAMGSGSEAGVPFAADTELSGVTTANAFSIVDGACTFSLANLMGERSTSNGGLADLRAGPSEQLFQNWFWYRATGDTREYALANQFQAQVSGSHARLTYLEPTGDGASANALLFDLEYTVTDLSADRGAEPPACTRCAVAIAASVRNRSAAPVSVELFSYNDMDLNNGSSGDTAIISGTDNQAQLLFDPPSATQPSVAGVFRVSSADATGWEIAPYPTIRARLADSVASDLTNLGSPFGPADYTGAEQWSIQLGPASIILPADSWLGSVDLEITVFRDGDVDGDCDVDLFDHALMQTGLTGPLP